MWKISQFTVVHNLLEYGLPTHNLVFNTYSSRSVVLVNKDWERIIATLQSPQGINVNEQEAILALVKIGILVHQDVDEQQQYEISFNATRYRPQRIYPILAITTGCNIGCTYCYEDGVKSKTMSTDVVGGVLRWLERRILEDGYREIYPGLFGGEPLLYPSILFALMDGFQELCQKYSVKGQFFMSSNGMLLTPKLSQDLASRGLTQIQISLDGTENIHNIRRMGKRGQPSYKETMQGIKVAVQNIPDVTIKVNFDRHNRFAIGELFDTLIDEGLKDAVNIKLEAIAYQFPDANVPHNPAYVMPPESKELATAYLQLMMDANVRGLQVTHDTAHTTPCMFSSHHGVIIGPSGNIYKCVSLVGRSEFKVGSVFENDYDKIEYSNQMNTTKRLAQCYEEKCPYIPVCAGGCAYEAIVRTGKYAARYCAKKYLEEFHYKCYIIRYQKQLEDLGMRPISPQDFYPNIPDL